LYYVEFIRKRPDVTWERFREVVGRAYTRWAEQHPEDAPVLAIGRTWRLGPSNASYIIVWRVDDFSRVDDWTELRRRDVESAAIVDEGTLSVSEIDAGMYEDIGSELH
jgi:hypothetical protein